MADALNVLLLEDRELDAQLVLRELRLANFEPVWQRVETEEAFARAISDELDVILADYQLPRFDALSALKMHRERQLDVPFILVSGTIGEQAAVDMIKHGAADYVLKDQLGRIGSVVRHSIEARQAERQRKEAVERFRTVVELCPDVIAIHADGKIEYVNPAVTRVIGFGVDDLIGRPVLDFVHPDDHAATLAEVDRQVRAGERVLQFENRYRHKDGSWRLLSWKSMPADGLMYATARDITVRRRMQQELLIAKNAAEAAHRELESFSYSVAHDLRAPLRGIDGFSQLLLEDCGDAVTETGRRYLRLIRESTRHMAQLIDDLLELSRVTRSELKREAVDISALAERVLARLRAASPARHADVRIEAGLEHWGDPRLLGVVLENLLSNAWKYSSKRELSRIELGRTTCDGVAAYFVRDNGAGFDMQYVHKLFGVFERLHAVHEFEGTGIGLATVRRIVERHGGRVWAHGQVDAGATFYFTLGPKEPTA